MFIAIDGPRPDRLGEAEAVYQCQQLVEAVDWPCTIKTLFRNENLGCKRAVSSAISWFFEQVETGIILEDDCLPDNAFFHYCQDMLTRYKNDERVMHISGANLVSDHRWSDDSYLFTAICHIWGWASWRRAWQKYDVTMATYPTRRESLITHRIPDPISQTYWLTMFDNCYKGNVDTWDFQWVYSIWANDGLGILPDRNLITNIGFGEQATHTKLSSPFAALPTLPFTEIHHPAKVEENIAATTFLCQTLYRPQSRLSIWADKVKIRLSLLKKKWANDL
ncbi:hemolytic protein HlpA [Spirosoma harenae]